MLTLLKITAGSPKRAARLVASTVAAELGQRSASAVAPVASAGTQGLEQGRAVAGERAAAGAGRRATDQIRVGAPASSASSAAGTSGMSQATTTSGCARVLERGDDAGQRVVGSAGSSSTSQSSGGSSESVLGDDERLEAGLPGSGDG